MMTMTMKRLARASLLLAIVAGPALVASGLQAQMAGDGEPTVVILVRHAERADDGTSRDPELSAEGHERAQCLAHTLAEAGVTAILSTDYQRTQQTAAPLAQALGLQVESYNPSAMGPLAASLGTRGGTLVVVGHSNTTPGLVEALGGDPVSPISEDEYDRLYTVFVSPSGVRSTLVSFCGS